METKEKLMTLAKACLENKEFYALSNVNHYNNLPSQKFTQKITCNSTKSSYGFQRLSFVQTHINGIALDKLQYCSSIDNYVYCKFSDEYLKANNEKSQEAYGSLNITFNDNPPLQIYVHSDDGDVETIGNFEVPINQYVPENKFLFRKAKYIHNGIVTYEVTKRHLNIYAKITFGTINARITLDEMNELCDIFLKNFEAFQLELDNDKLNERLEKFAK